MEVTFRQARLSNGLTLIAEVDPASHSSAIGFFVKTGARDEDTRVMGVSHFLEHMMFKGTPTRSAERINQDFDRIGARNNAYTSGEMTCFHATVLPDKLLGRGGATEILCDMMRPALRQEDFDTEKNVILEEIAMYQDNPFWVLYERAMEERYSPEPGQPMHPLGHRVLGTRESITALTSTQMREYFEHRYSADNTVVAMAGKLDFDAVCEEVDRACGRWARTGATRTPGGPTPPERQFEMRDKKVNRAYMLCAWAGPGADDDRRYAASLLATVLGGPDNSRFHWALVETGLAESADAGFEPRDGCGDVFVFACCDPDRREEVSAIVDRELERLADSLRDEDLEKIRCKAATGVTVAGERPGGRMQRLGRQWMYQARYTTLEQELERINRVTVADLRAVLRDFPMRPRTLGWLLPEAG